MPAEMRHVTNLQTPYDAVDSMLLTHLGVENTDYAIGAPIPANPANAPGAKSLDQLNAAGVVGLYVTLASIQKPSTRGTLVVRLPIGWYVPVAQVWESLPVLT